MCHYQLKIEKAALPALWKARDSIATDVCVREYLSFFYKAKGIREKMQNKALSIPSPFDLLAKKKPGSRNYPALMQMRDN
jgi:hypothetical protein